MIRKPPQGSAAAGPEPRQPEEVEHDQRDAVARSQPTPAQLYYLRRQKLRRAPQTGQR